MRYRRLIPPGIAFLLAALPGIYCLFCSSPLPWPVLRIFGAMLLTAAICRMRKIPGGLLAFLWLFTGSLEAISYQHSGNTFDLKFLHHAAWSSITEGAAGVWTTVLAGLLLLGIGTGYFIRLAGQKCNSHGSITVRIFLLILIPVCSPAVPAGLLLYRVIQASGRLAPLDHLPQTGIKPAKLDRDHISAEPGKNLILIYLESLENHYFNEKEFPGLLPNLTRLRAQSVDFTDITMARNADFTFGGMYSSLTGSILTDTHYRISGSAAARNNAGFDPDLGSRLAGLPSVLQKAGYFQMLLVGHDPRFAGTDIFAMSAGYTRIFSAMQAWRELGMKEIPHAVWGVRDHSLLKLARAAYQRMSAPDMGPFHLTIVTVDAHHPDGFVEPDGPRYTGWKKTAPQLLHAIHAMDHWLGKFIADLQKTPAWNQTVVVFLTDHLAMRNTLSDALNNGTPRKLVFFALNAGSARKISVPGKTFDAAPTVLALLGVRHNAVFPLGENLLDSPSVKRLSGDAPANEPYLAGYLKQWSSAPLPENFTVKTQQKPYPALVLGKRVLPLFTQWGIPAFPKHNECIVIRISAGRRIEEARRLDSSAAMLNFVQNCSSVESFAILAGTDTAKALLPGKSITGPLLITGKPGKWRFTADDSGSGDSEKRSR